MIDNQTRGGGRHGRIGRAVGLGGGGSRGGAVSGAVGGGLGGAVGVGGGGAIGGAIGGAVDGYGYRRGCRYRRIGGAGDGAGAGGRRGCGCVHVGQELPQRSPRIPLWSSVYVVSLNHSHLIHLRTVWLIVSCRFRLVPASAFFSKTKGHYDSMGVDCLDTLMGAMHLHCAPALIFNGGMATTRGRHCGRISFQVEGTGGGLQGVRAAGGAGATECLCWCSLNRDDKVQPACISLSLFERAA